MCLARLHPLACVPLPEHTAGLDLCTASADGHGTSSCSPPFPLAVPPSGGSGDSGKLGPLGQPIRRTNTFRWVRLPVAFCMRAQPGCRCPASVLGSRCVGVLGTAPGH